MSKQISTGGEMAPLSPDPTDHEAGHAGHRTVLANARCVLCKGELDSLKFFPFCSHRCRLTDLGKWASEEYRVPAGDVNAERRAEVGDEFGEE